MPKKSIQQRFQDPRNVEVLVGLFIDFLLAQPTAAFIHADHIMDAIDRGLDATLTDQWIVDHLKPFIRRESERSADRKDRVSDWVEPEMQAELRSISMRPIHLNRDFLREAVQQDSVRHMLRSVIEETLERFVSTLKPGGSGGGLIGSVGRGALGFASRAGRGILGQIGGQLEGQLRQAASAFVQSSTTVMLDRLVILMSSPETAKHLGASGLAAYEAIMKLKTAKVWQQINESQQSSDLLDALAGQIAFTLNREEFRSGIRDEITAFISVEGERPLGDLLGDDEYRMTLKDNMVALATPLVIEFAQTPDGLKWLEG